MSSPLDNIVFRDRSRALEELARLGAGMPDRVRARVERLLASVPDPDASLESLERFRVEAPAVFDRVVSSPAALQYLVTTFSYSRFLSGGLMRNPESILQLAGSGNLYRVLSAEDFGERLLQFLGAACASGVPPALEFARFRRRRLLRIVLRDVLGFATLADVTEELSNLADATLEVAYRCVREDLVRRYGEPVVANAEGVAEPCGFAVIALGKLGGKELNYSSDIDLMFVYSGNGQTTGPHSISNKEFFIKLANQLTELLSTYTAEGLCYRVDLRLRPDGRLGEVAISLAGAKSYYEQRARDWEKQMLIKARVCAGDIELGRDLLDAVDPLIYSSSLDFGAVEAVSETRARIGEKLAARRGSNQGLDVKLAPGGIRDIEFLVQCLQRLHGGREPWVRHGGTLFALFRLRDKGLLTNAEYGRLASAYQFLRHLEHRLQFDEDRQTHTLPSSRTELDVLARKMPAAGGEQRDAAWLESQLQEHLTGVRELYTRVIHAQQPMYYSGPADGAPPAGDPREELGPHAAVNVNRYLDRAAPQLAVSLAGSRVNRGRERLDHYLEQALAHPRLLERLDNDPGLVERVVDLFEHSAYFGDQLLRYPELLEEIDGGPEPVAEGLEDAAALRRYFRRRMMRVQADSIFGGEPIFTTLARTSDLADTVIAAAYRIAVANTPAPGSGYTPSNQMMVIALGRLGMREFDLASDADLVFVIPDTGAEHHLYWTGVAERMIQNISAYTGEGVIFSVDTRLRPNGREGDLVQTESAYKGYFAKKAEAWEGIAHMKSRAVAGDLDRATEFLHDLQEVDWRRYGQSGRSRQELAQMRARLEKEQGTRNPLKAGPGGYYDIDFVLMYLRLRGAGIFYKVLNTPERIDVIEKMGHLDREDADFLRDAATFYRSVDHGLRVATGQTAGSLPAAQAQFEALTALVNRWIPEHLRNQRLDATLAGIRRGTRAFFNRIFGA